MIPQRCVIFPVSYFISFRNFPVFVFKKVDFFMMKNRKSESMMKESKKMEDEKL